MGGTFWCKLENSPHSQKKFKWAIFLKICMFLLEEWVHEMLSEIEQKINISNKMGEGVQQC